MALLDYTPEKREIKARGQVFGEVQGLSLEHICVLLREHLPDLDALIELFTGDKMAKAFESETWIDLALPMITQAPGLVSNVIALAADAPQEAPKVTKWPMAVQIAALMLIFELSFTEIGEVKKALGLIATLRTQMKTTGTTGTTKSKKRR